MTLSRTPGVTVNAAAPPQHPAGRRRGAGVFAVGHDRPCRRLQRTPPCRKRTRPASNATPSPNLEKTLANGEKLSLVIPAKGFAQSVHNSSGCEGCHSDIDLASHGKEPKTIASKRANSLERMETCRDCHKKTVKQYEDSVHSALVRTRQRKGPAVLGLPQPARDALRQGKSRPAMPSRSSARNATRASPRPSSKACTAAPATRRSNARTATRPTASRPHPWART